MFYRPADGHGLPHNPFNALITPRPIAWVSTRGSDGAENLAPYSFFNAVSYVPAMVMFSSTSAKPDRDGTKDTVANIRETGVFCLNIVSYALRDAMNESSGPWPKEIDEFDKAGLQRVSCETIDCSRVAAAPAALECKLVQEVVLPGRANIVTFGEVTGVHIDDDILVDGMIDITRYQPLARMGYLDYTKVDRVFPLERPKR